ncbi:hypothetical protein [Owenweeksia hongkongensis]|uniref:hypothetical protein n=1 Tax=Owenweeksia hongkongensis TaxID=253245 RepID=UPI003A8E2C32
MNLTLQKSGAHPIVPLAAAAFLITLLLFFIDEGNYSFENITHPGNIVALSFYFMGMMLAQSISLAVAERFMERSKAVLTSIIIGIPVGVMATIFFFLVLRG